jgi:hypothetical protein
VDLVERQTQTPPQTLFHAVRRPFFSLFFSLFFFLFLLFHFRMLSRISGVAGKIVGSRVLNHPCTPSTRSDMICCHCLCCHPAQSPQLLAFPWTFMPPPPIPFSSLGLTPDLQFFSPDFIPYKQAASWSTSRAVGQRALSAPITKVVLLRVFSSWTA